MSLEIGLTRPRRRLPLRKKVFLCLLTTCLMLICVELGLRLAQPRVYEMVSAYFKVHQYSREIDGDLTPGTHARFYLPLNDGYPLWDFTLAVDEDGLRRPLTVVESSPVKEAPIVHCIGDSMTMGWGVEAEESYPSCLQQILGDRWHVVNTGVDGVGLLSAVERARRYEGQYPPKKIVYAHCENDLDDDENTLARLAKPSWQHAVYQCFWSMQTHSYAARVATVPAFVSILPGQTKEEAAVWTYRSQPPTLPEFRAAIDHTDVAMNATTIALQSLAERCRQQKIELVVIILASTMQNSLNIAAYCEKSGQPYLIFRLIPELMILGDGHLNPKGNEALAQAIARRFFNDDRQTY